MERRRATRYPFSMRATLFPLLEEYPKPVVTTTRDISADGIYLEWDEPAHIGSEIKILVELPAKLVGRPVLLRCRSRIVRLDGSNGTRGVAAKILSYDFQADGKDYARSPVTAARA